MHFRLTPRMVSRDCRKAKPCPLAQRVLTTVLPEAPPTQDRLVLAPQKSRLLISCRAIHSRSKVGASCAGPGEEESARLGGSTSFTVNLNFGQLCLSLSSVTSGKRAGHRPVRKVNPAGFVETKGPARLNPEVFLRFCLGSRGSCWWKEKLLTHWSFLLTEGSSVALGFGMVFTNT